VAYRRWRSDERKRAGDAVTSRANAVAVNTWDGWERAGAAAAAAASRRRSAAAAIDADTAPAAGVAGSARGARGDSGKAK